MKELTLSEKIVNKTNEYSRIIGNTANNGTYRNSLIIISELETIAKALCITMKKQDYIYDDQPQRRSDFNDTDYRSGTIPKVWALLANLWEYNGFLISSYDNKATELIEYRNKIRVIRIFKQWAKKHYSYKRLRILNALKQDSSLFGKYNNYLVEIIKDNNFNNFNKPAEKLTIEFLSILKTPPTKLILEITKQQKIK